MRPPVEKSKPNLATWDALKWALRPGNGLVEVAEASGRAESDDESVGREIEVESRDEAVLVAVGRLEMVATLTGNSSPVEKAKL